MNWTALKKLRAAERKEAEIESDIKLSRRMEDSLYGKKVLKKLEDIAEHQELYNQSLLHVLRTDLLTVTDEILYINRKRNTVSSKWSNLAARRERYALLEEIMDAAFMSYTRLGGNHLIAERYEECKAILKDTKREAEE